MGLLLLVIIYITNNWLKHKIYAYKFHLLDDNIRNYDVLVIGDEYNTDAFGNKLIYKNCLKYRSLFSSYLILRERFSLLREDGNGIVYIVVNRKYLSGISPIDYINFHQITCTRLNCFPNGFSRKFPIFPFLTWQMRQKFLINKPAESEWNKLVNQIGQFCNERNINLKIIKK